EPERLREAESDVGLARRAHATAFRKRWRLEPRDVAGIRHEAERLAEIERIDRIRLVALRGERDTGDRARTGDGAGARRHDELVALAERLRVLLQTVEHARDREDQEDDRHRRGEDGDERRRAERPRERESRPEA